MKINSTAAKHIKKYCYIIGLLSFLIAFFACSQMLRYQEKEKKASSATKNHFICSQGKYRIDAASIVASPLHKTERRIFYLRRVRVAQSGSLAQDTSGFILQDDSPRILVNLNGSIVAGIDNLVIRLGNFPASIPARFLCQHDGSGRVGH